jgi:hypothetical protein
MVRNIIGPLVAAALGFLCVIGSKESVGVGVQLLSIVVMCFVVGLAINLVARRYFWIVTFYSVAFTGGVLTAIVLGLS